MYVYKFPNSPAVIAEFNRLGPDGVFEFLRPHNWELRAFFSQQEMAAVKKLFVNSTAHHFCSDMRIDEFYRSVVGSPDGDMTAAGLGHLSYLDERRLRRFFGHIARFIWLIDNQPDEAIQQFKSGEFDVEPLHRKQLEILSKDPLFVADKLVKRVVGSQVFSERFEKLVEISIGRIALKESRRDITWIERQDFSQINHIADWLVAAISNRSSWLTNVDDAGRPKKLMKFGTFEAMHAEADKHMRLQLAKEEEQLSSDDEEPFADDGGTFRIVRLRTPKALDCESSAMRHCIGQGGYDKFLDAEDHLLLSLRDTQGRRHATIEVLGNEVVQFKGKANCVPKNEYRGATETLLAQKGIEFRDKNSTRVEIPFDPEAPAYLGAFRGMRDAFRRVPRGLNDLSESLASNPAIVEALESLMEIDARPTG